MFRSTAFDVWSDEALSQYGVPKRAKLNKSCSFVEEAPKKTITFSLSITGHMITVPIVQCKMVNYEWYSTTCLPEIFRDICKTNKTRRFILYDYKASFQTSAETTAFLKGQYIELMDHPPYSPNAHPLTCFCFLTKKNCVINNSLSPKQLPKRSKSMFWRCLNRNGKSTSKIGLSTCTSVLIFKANILKTIKPFLKTPTKLFTIKKSFSRICYVIINRLWQ